MKDNNGAADGKVPPELPKDMTRRPTTSLVLHVPQDAKVFLAGRETSTTGSVRQYATTKLGAGRAVQDYSVRVEVQRDGHTVVKEQHIVLQAGRRHELTVEVTPTDIAAAAARATR